MSKLKLIAYVLILFLILLWFLSGFYKCECYGESQGCCNIYGTCHYSGYHENCDKNLPELNYRLIGKIQNETEN